MRLGELFAVAREIKGLTLRELEAQCGVSNAVLSQIEKGHVKDPGFSTVVRVADALGLPIERVVTLTHQRPPVGALRAVVIGKVTGTEREGDQVPGMRGAICHACGLGYKCADADCPNEKTNPAFPWLSGAVSVSDEK